MVQKEKKMGWLGRGSVLSSYPSQTSATINKDLPLDVQIMHDKTALSSFESNPSPMQPVLERD